MRSGGSGHSLPENAPSNAIEYFETEDHESSVALFQDRLDIRSSGPLGGKGTIKIKDITSWRKYGSTILINTSDRGQIEFSLSGLRDISSARRFVDTLQGLIDGKKN